MRENIVGTLIEIGGGLILPLVVFLLTGVNFFYLVLCVIAAQLFDAIGLMIKPVFVFSARWQWFERIPTMTIAIRRYWNPIQTVIVLIILAFIVYSRITSSS